MSRTVLIDYGCHAFTYRLAAQLADLGYSIEYFANGSLESPNLKSLPSWVEARPKVVRSIKCLRPYGKMGLHRRLLGELEWAKHCIQALEADRPTAVIVSTVPLAAVARIQKWAENRRIPLVYWLQDFQGRAIHGLLSRRIGFAGRVLGSFAHLWEQDILEKSRMVITIAPGHERELPAALCRSNRYALLENWANIEEFPEFPRDNEWAVRHNLDKTLNVVYSGTLGLKHDLSTFLTLASNLRSRPDVRVVVVSSGEASDTLRSHVTAARLSNLIILPFQPYQEVPKVLASAAVLIAPLEASAGVFCVPSKVLSYFCAGRPTVISIHSDNPAAATIKRINAGTVISPGDGPGFIQAVRQLLDNPEMREKTGRHARTYAEQTFGLDRVIQRFLDILSRCDVHLPLKSPKLANSIAAASA